MVPSGGLLMAQFPEVVVVFPEPMEIDKGLDFVGVGVGAGVVGAGVVGAGVVGAGVVDVESWVDFELSAFPSIEFSIPS